MQLSGFPAFLLQVGSYQRFFGHKNNKTLEFFPFGKVLHGDGIDWDVLILKIMSVTFS